MFGKDKLITLHVKVVKKEWKENRIKGDIPNQAYHEGRWIVTYRLDNGKEVAFFTNSKTQAHMIEEGESGVIIFRRKYSFIDEFIHEKEIESSVQAVNPDEILSKYPNIGYNDTVTKKDKIIAFVLILPIIIFVIYVLVIFIGDSQEKEYALAKEEYYETYNGKEILKDVKEYSWDDQGRKNKCETTSYNNDGRVSGTYSETWKYDENDNVIYYTRSDEEEGTSTTIEYEYNNDYEKSKVVQNTSSKDGEDTKYITVYSYDEEGEDDQNYTMTAYEGSVSDQNVICVSEIADTMDDEGNIASEISKVTTTVEGEETTADNGTITEKETSEETETTTKSTYKYDEFDNVIEETHTVSDAENTGSSLKTVVGKYTYTYDENDNMTEKTYEDNSDPVSKSRTVYTYEEF